MLYALSMPQDDPAALFWRPLGRTPLATSLAYGIAILHLSVSIAEGLWDDTRESIANGFLDGIYWFGGWVALGTIIALLAQVADRGRREVSLVERRVTDDRVPVELP